MDRIFEIEARMSAIAAELETASGEALTALETEVNALTEERKSIMAENAKKQALRTQVANGTVGTAHRTAVQTATAESKVEAEERAFADFLFGKATEMRTGEQNFSTGNNGAVIPTTIANRIIDAVKDICPILRDADVYSVKGVLKIPVYGKANSTHDITVGYATEFTDLTADAGAFTSVDLNGYLVGALTLVGKSIQNNAAFDIVGFVVRKMAESIAVFIEGELLAGTGSSDSHCTGALSTTNTINAGSVSAITADNLIELQACVKQAYQANACWTMNPATFTAIKKLKYVNGQYIVNEDFTGAFPYRILGKPVYLSDNMPTIESGAKAILYGDYSGLSVNIRENISVEVLREKYATQHAIGVVAWMELDSKVSNPQKLATLTMSTGD